MRTVEVGHFERRTLYREDESVVAAKTLALTAAELFVSPDTIAAATAELHERRGADFVYRPLVGDGPPQLDYRGAGK